MPHKVNGLFQASRIDRVRKENADTLTLFLDASLPDAAPGQFVMAWLPGVGEKPFSISGNDPLTLTVCAVGPVSRALCELKPADQLWVRGPLGKDSSFLARHISWWAEGMGQRRCTFWLRRLAR